MTFSSRQFEDKPAVRESVPLLIGIMGPSGGGKTFSALRLATGIQRVVGGDIGVIDTEARRALHYADYFKFRHMEFNAPFGSLDYLAAIQHFVKNGVKTVIVDSMTHEHAGVGGYLEYAETELDRMAGDNYGKRQACKLASFIKPGAARRAMIDSILQMNANFVFCFRAKEKVKPLKGNDGKTEIVNIGFVPVAGTELVFEMTACCLLMPHAGGVPTWISEEIGERMMIKTAKQFDSIFAKQEPLSEDIGQKLAEWAKGGASTSSPDIGDIQTLVDLGDGKARESKTALETWWKSLTAPQRIVLKDKLPKWKETAQ